MRVNIKKLTQNWPIFGLLISTALVIAGCQGNQAKIDLPSPSGKPAYLMSVDSSGNPNLFSPKGEPWQDCTSRACKSMIIGDEKAIQRIFSESKATEGFLLLSFDDLKNAGLINMSLFSEAHADDSCKPRTIHRRNAIAKVVYPPGCPLP